MAQYLRGYKKIQASGGGKKQFPSLQKLCFQKIKKIICTSCQGFAKGYRTIWQQGIMKSALDMIFKSYSLPGGETLYTESLHCFQRGHYSILYVYKVLNSHLFSVVSGFNVSNLEEGGIMNKFVFRLSWCFQKDLYPDICRSSYMCLWCRNKLRGKKDKPPAKQEKGFTLTEIFSDSRIQSIYLFN